jgi:hypothetical protein
MECENIWWYELLNFIIDKKRDRAEFMKDAFTDSLKLHYETEYDVVD